MQQRLHALRDVCLMYKTFTEHKFNKAKFATWLIGLWQAFSMWFKQSVHVARRLTVWRYVQMGLYTTRVVFTDAASFVGNCLVALHRKCGNPWM